MAQEDARDKVCFPDRMGVVASGWGTQQDSGYQIRSDILVWLSCALSGSEGDTLPLLFVFYCLLLEISPVETS